MRSNKTFTALFSTLVLGLSLNAQASLIPNWYNDFGTELTDLTDEDDLYQEVALSPIMSVYGASYNSVSVNTNGSLNFTETTDDYDVGDEFEDDYGVSIAAFWSDLDPSENDDARIFQNTSVFDGQNAYIFTWFEIPDYEDEDLLNTFQAIITESGDIQLNFLSLDGVDPDEHPDEGVVGISDGSGSNFDYQTMDTWDFPRSEFSIGYTWDGNDYTRSEWSWDQPVAVSEPSTLIVLSLGLLGLARLRSNKK
ncbi:hypothetical protein Q4574_07700 [Aliiglaciecola sp. 3_MG-2023]|uniref:nidogen-like domain-containing protein n=1 Tax=Aliiglaciecola sp. 3_MG-2023 TaxID=3062644 RepID=UPI0026E3592A|nr:nidogen-like domain-containing protein [Aliiglaciecola sp. 3_MG-2023]MDO6693165.1 hypothetical protein [Aliiglaciecola sp. 3_MG-2023]